MAEVTGFDRATSAAREYAAAWGDAVAAIEQGSGDRSTRLEAAALHVHRAGRQIEALCAGLAEVHAEVAAVAALAEGATVEGYAGADLLRVVRAAIAFRKAAPRHTWPHQAWGQMAEICAAVDRKPGPDERTARALPVQHGLAGLVRNAGDELMHAALVHPVGVYHAMCGGGELDERSTAYAYAVLPPRRCGKFGCREVFEAADQEIAR